MLIELVMWQGLFSTSGFQNKGPCSVFAFLSIGSHKDGYEIFASWKKVWTTNGKSEPSLKAFMADQQLPFWVRASSVPAYC